jgi:hypothetical protein
MCIDPTRSTLEAELDENQVAHPSFGFPLDTVGQ